MKRNHLKHIALGAATLLMSVAFTGCSFIDRFFGKTDEEPERQRYTVIFDTNGGTQVSTEGIYVDDIPVRPADPFKEGHTFGGWFLDSDFTQEYLFDAPLNKDVTLYAKLSPKSFEGYSLIYTAADLAAISEDAAGKYLLAEDINLKGDVWTPIDNFSGTLDGNGHKIFNFVMAENNTASGFFRVNSGTIENVTFDDYNFSTTRSASNGNYAGLIVALNSGTISNCTVTENGTINTSTSFNVSSATMYFYVGGACGSNAEGGTLENVHSYANIECSSSVGSSWNRTTNNHLMVGGVVGENFGMIGRSAYHGTMTVNAWINSTEGSKYEYTYLGGIVGAQRESGKTNACAADGTINSTSKSTTDGNHNGMICGTNYGGLIEDCAAGGKINREGRANTSYIGGAVGHNANAGKISNCYVSTEITETGDTGTTVIGGIVGRVEANGIVKACCMVGNTSSANASAYGYIIASPDRNGYTCFKCFYSTDSRILLKEEVKSEGTCTDGTTKTLAELQSKDFLIDTLYWETSVWNVGSGHPTLK